MSAVPAVSALTKRIRNSDIPEVDRLNADDQKAFEIAEATVRNGFDAYLAAVKSLKIIKENKWYRSLGYTNFEVYVSERFGISRNYADYLVKSADVLDNLLAYFGNKSHQGGTFSGEPASIAATAASGEALPIMLPTSERVARPLAQLPVAEQGPEWEKIVTVAQSENVPITAARVQSHVDEHLGKGESRPSVHHPAPTTIRPATPETAPAKVAAATAATATAPDSRTNRNPSHTVSKSEAAATGTLLFIHQAEIASDSPRGNGEKIVTRFTIKDLPDGKFQLWTERFTVKEKAGAETHVVPLDARETCVRPSLSSAIKATSDEAEAIFSVDKSARVQYPTAIGARDTVSTVSVKG